METNPEIEDRSGDVTLTAAPDARTMGGQVLVEFTEPLMPTVDEVGEGIFSSYATQGIPPYNPDSISIGEYDDMGLDAQVRMCQLVIRLPIIKADWTIEAQDKIAAKELEDNLRAIGFDQVRQQLLDAVFYGFCFAEKVWENSGTSWLYRKLKPLHPGSIRIHLQKNGDFNGAEQNSFGYYHVDYPITITPAKSFLYTHQERYGNFYGESHMKSSYPFWYVKKVLRKYRQIALERVARPIIKGNQTDPNGDLPSLKEQLRDVYAKYYIACPYGTDVSILAPPNFEAQYEQALAYEDTMIARGMLVPDLLVTNSSTGAYALSKTHAAFFVLAEEAIQSEFASYIDKYLLAPWIGYNVGFNRVDKIAAKIKFEPISEEDKAAIATVLNVLLTHGAIQPNEEWIRGLFGFPKPEVLPAPVNHIPAPSQTAPAPQGQALVPGPGAPTTMTDTHKRTRKWFISRAS